MSGNQKSTGCLMSMETPTTDQIRDRIDSGQTGEKVAMPDPAAAPLGTDAEAGGAPPTKAERALAARSMPTEPDVRSPPSGALIYVALIAAVAAVLVLVLLTAR